MAAMAQKTEDTAELSEGEVVDSSGSSTNGDLNPTDTPPAQKKRKVSGHIDSRTGGWVSAAMANRKVKRRIKKREKWIKNKMKKEPDKLELTVPDAASSSWVNLELSSTQATITQALSQLTEGKPSSATPLPTLKTSLFQSLMLHFVLSRQARESGSTSGEEPAMKYLVIWLSNVAEEFFSSSEKHFPKLKLFNPSVQFKIEHPGTTRFAKLGLESFMVLPNNKPEEPSTPITQDPRPNRTAYLLTKEQLEEHSFPVLHTPVCPIGRDCSNYCRVVEWPEDLILSAATEHMPMFAIDCEMVGGQHFESELARISIVDESLECLYDTYVKPSGPITDYRTKYSGIVEDTLRDVTTSLSDVQEKLRSLLPSNSILIGHSLENDFYAMKFVHPFVIDTSCIFTPYAQPRNKPSLRRLHKELLTSDIQTDSNGHCSIEDATACMKLVQLKLREGKSCQVAFSQPSTGLLRELQSQACKTTIVDKAGVVRLFGKSSSFVREVDSDTAVVPLAKELVPQSDLTFVQLHDMENFVKSGQSRNSERLLQVADGIDSNIVKLVENCPARTLVFVVCGSSEISRVKYCQQQDIVDFRKLKEAVMGARTGMVVAFMVN